MLRTFAAAAALIAAAFPFSSDTAAARSGGGGHGFGFGSSRPAFSRFHAGSPAVGHRGHAFARRSRFGLPYGDLLYGYADNPSGYGEPGTASPAMIAIPIYRPSCHMESETRPIPAEGGGRRFVTITRCVVSEAAPPAAPYSSDNAPSRRDDPELTTNSIEPRRPDSTDAGGCRSTRTVPTATGGERAVTVTRC